ncbi:MAG: hypothetical protein AB8E82_01985 [Aureispira sp.]
MKIQKEIALFVCVTILVLVACQKDEIPSNVPQNSIANPKLGGNFYAQRERRGGFSDPFNNNYSSWRDTADATIDCIIDGDTLAILGFRIKIDSMNQTVFSYADGVGTYGVTSIEVRYGNTYDSIYITYNTPCGTYGNCSTINYRGKKNRGFALPNSGSLYRLQVVQQKIQFVPPSTFRTLIDTQYTKDMLVEYTCYPMLLAPDLSLLTFDLDNTLINARGFGSYYRHRTDASNEWVHQQIYWKNDSFCLKEQTLDYPNGRSYPADTTYYLYQGRVK